MTERSSRRPRLVERLLDPAALPASGASRGAVETHISWVLLAGDRVYKIKKPVNLGFLDFTTLARRRRFCHDEVRLNRRLTSDIYLGVVEIRGSAGAPRFEGRGRAIEVAVLMRRLPAERMLDRLVRENAAPPALLDEIGSTVARFHAAADTGGEIDELGGIETIRRNWEENFAQTAAVGPELLADETRRRVREYVETFLEREEARFAARVAAGTQPRLPRRPAGSARLLRGTRADLRLHRVQPSLPLRRRGRGDRLSHHGPGAAGPPGPGDPLPERLSRGERRLRGGAAARLLLRLPGVGAGQGDGPPGRRITRTSGRGTRPGPCSSWPGASWRPIGARAWSSPPA